MDSKDGMYFYMGYGVDEAGSQYVSEVIHDELNQAVFEDNNMRVCDNDDNQLFSHDEGMLKRVHANIAQDEETEACVNRTPSIARKVRKSKHTPMWTEQDGTQRPILPCQSYCYNIHVSHPDVGNALFKLKFLFRLCMPYA